MADGEAFVVDAEAVHDGGVDVVDVDGLRDRTVAEVVGLTVHNAAFDAAAGTFGVTPSNFRGHTFYILVFGVISHFGDVPRLGIAELPILPSLQAVPLPFGEPH